MPKTLRCNPKLFDKDFTGKVVIITGGTGGIGLCTAQQLVKQKATVVMAGRNAELGTKVAQEAGGVFMKLDLTSLQSVREFAAAFLANYDRLDILVNNAGVMLPPLARTKDDFELTMGTNHFGHFLLTELLKEVLEKSAPSRVVMLSSCAAAITSPKMGSEAKVDFSDLHWKSRKYDKGEAYAQSKLANVLHAMELPKRYTGVTAYSLHPGWVQSNLIRHAVPGCCKCCLECCAMKCVPNGMINVWDGTQTSLHCILSEPEDLENGAFYSQFGVYKDKASQAGGWPMKLPNAEATPENATRLWEESVKLVGLDSSAVIGAPTEVKAPAQTPMPAS